MTELGKQLKEAREAKEFTLDDLQDITKIQKRYLSAIESGNYDIIPGKFYVRAFIKQYAESVGLDPEVLFDEYRHEIPSVYEDDLPEQLSRTQSRREISDRTSKFFEIFPKVLVTLFVIGAIAFLWYFGQKLLTNESPATPTEQSTGANEPVEFEESGKLPNNQDETGENENTGDKSAEGEQNEKTPEKQEPEKKQQLTVTETKGQDTIYELSNTDTFQLRLKIVEGKASWIEIRNDNNQVLQKGITLNDNTPEITHDFTEEEYVRIRIGASQNTEVFVNDTKLEYELDPVDQVTQNIIIHFVKEEE